MPQKNPIFAYRLRDALSLSRIVDKMKDLPLFELVRRERNLLLFSVEGGRFVCVFQFGVVVIFGEGDDKQRNRLLKAVDCPPEEETEPIDENEAVQLEPDDYECLIDPERIEEADVETVTIKKLTPNRVLLISYALAQSYTIDLLDERVTGTMGFFDQVYDNLARKGKMHTGSKKALKAIGTSGNAILFAVNRLALLDKPDLAWEDSDCHLLYDSLAKAFELEDRFAALRLKLDFIRSSSETVLNAIDTKRGEMLEIIIIILITIEILFALGGMW